MVVTTIQIIRTFVFIMCFFNVSTYPPWICDNLSLRNKVKPGISMTLSGTDSFKQVSVIRLRLILLRAINSVTSSILGTRDMTFASITSGTFVVKATRCWWVARPTQPIYAFGVLSIAARVATCCTAKGVGHSY